MLHLLDANVLITAHNLYYPIDGVPEFWEWIVHVAERGSLNIPLENFEEIRDGSKDEYKDLLFGSIQQEMVRSALLLAEEADERLVAQVINEGYATDLTDEEILQLGRDPFLIAYGLAAPADRCIVTTEVSKPRKPSEPSNSGCVQRDGCNLVRHVRNGTNARIRYEMEEIG